MFDDLTSSYTCDGLKIVSDPSMTELEVYIAELSWKERLVAWPWKPWRDTKTKFRTVPSSMIINDGKGNLVMHPEVAEKLIAHISEQRSYD